MRRPLEAWRRSLSLWGLPFLFCLVNLLVLGFYFSFYAGEVERLEQGYERAEDDLAELSRQSEEIEAFLGHLDVQRRSSRTLYREHFQTEAKRFTRAIQEVKELARDAGLNPTSFSYPQVVLGDEGLIQRQIQFSVEGTYRQMRTFINFLELTDQFLTLNSVSLTEGGADRLRIQLLLSTVFAATAGEDEPAPGGGAVPPADTGPGAPPRDPEPDPATGETT